MWGLRPKIGLGEIGWLLSSKLPLRFGQLWVTKAKAQSNFRSGVEEGASDLPLYR